MIANLLLLFDKIRHYPFFTTYKMRKTSKGDEFKKGPRSFERGKLSTK